MDDTSVNTTQGQTLLGYILKILHLHIKFVPQTFSGDRHGARPQVKHMHSVYKTYADQIMAKSRQKALTYVCSSTIPSHIPGAEPFVYESQTGSTLELVSTVSMPLTRLRPTELRDVSAYVAFFLESQSFWLNL